MCKRPNVVLSQPIHQGYRNRDDLSINWIRANVKASACLIVFPSMHFAAHHPTWDGGPFPGVDLLAAHLVACGLPPEEALRRLLSTDLLSDSDIEREIDASVAEIQRREDDDDIDIKISDFIEQHARREMMFHISNHPLRHTAVVVANRILEQLGYPRRVSVEGLDYQRDTHIPPLPAITRFLALRGGWYPEPELYDTARMHTVQGMPLRLFYQKVVEGLASVPPARLFSMIAGRWPAIQVFRRLAQNNATIPGIERWRV